MDDLIQQGVDAYKSGDRENARKLLISATKQYPNDERSWGWLYNVCNSDRERVQCLKQVIRINPQNEKASQILNKFTEVDHPPELQLNKAEKNNQVTLGLLLCGGALLFVIVVYAILNNITPTAKSAQVLQTQGFVRNSSYDANCTSSCKTYTNSQLGMVATVYDNGSFSIGVVFTFLSDLNGAQTQVLKSVLSSLYNPTITQWIVNYIVDLSNTPTGEGVRTSTVNGYTLNVQSSLTSDSVGYQITITIVPVN